VLKPKRELALAVWYLPERNPFFHIVSGVIEGFAGSAPREPDAPDPFRFAQPGKLRDVLTDAGAAAPSERLLQFEIEAPVSIEDFWTLRCEMSETFREKIARFSKDQLAEAKRQGMEALRDFSTDRGINFPAEVLIVSGTKS
jgi:hypothetical protein